VPCPHGLSDRIDGEAGLALAGAGVPEIGVVMAERCWRAPCGEPLQAVAIEA
jgi:hypothetical protein